MPAPAGYSLEQLLSWCLEDRLIDSFERRESRVVIIQGELRYELAAREAECFLKAAFRQKPSRKVRAAAVRAVVEQAGVKNAA